MKKSLKFLFFLMGLVLAVSFFGCEQLAKYEDLLNGGDISGVNPGDGDDTPGGNIDNPGGGGSSSTLVALTLDLNGGTYRNSTASLSMKLNVGDNIKDYMYRKTFESLPYPDFMDPTVTGSLYNAYHIRKRVGNDVYWLAGFTRTRNGNDFVTTVDASDNNTTVFAKWVLAKDILPVYYDESNTSAPVKIVFRPEDYGEVADNIQKVVLMGSFPDGEYWDPTNLPSDYKYTLTRDSDNNFSVSLSEDFLVESSDRWYPTVFKFVAIPSSGIAIWYNFENSSGYTNGYDLPLEFMFIFSGESSYNPPDYKLYPKRIVDYFKGIYTESSTVIEMVNITLDGNGGTSEGITSKLIQVYPSYPVTSTYGFIRNGYLLKGWSRSLDRDEFPANVVNGWTLYASWLDVDTIETKPVVKDGNGDYVLVFNPVLYGSFVGTTDTGNLEIYVYGGAVPGSTQKVEYSPETKDYRLTVPASHIDSLPVESRDFKFKSTINGTEKYFGSWEYRQSEVYLPSEYVLQDGEYGEFLVPDGVSSTITVTLNGNGGTADGNIEKQVKTDPRWPITEAKGFERAGYLLKGWSKSSVVEDFPSSYEGESENLTLYAIWIPVDSIDETMPVIRESNGDYTFICNPALYTQFIGYSDDGSLDIYLRGSFNFWGFEEDGETWHKDSKYKMTYYPETKDYRLTLTAEEASVSSWGQTGEFKFYLNLDDISGGWLGVSDYRRSEVNLPSSYCKEGTDYNFKIPDTL